MTSSTHDNPDHTPARRAHKHTDPQLTTRLSHNHLLTQFFIILREVTTQ